jgi:hypothetical protein
MPSKAREDLFLRLNDVQEIFEAHKSLTGGGRGRPAERQGAALTRAGIVLLAAALEAFVEDLFEETALFIMTENTEEERQYLFKHTSRAFGNANVFKINMLYFNLGIPWVLNDIRWQKCSNKVFRSKLDKLINARNSVAHGHPVKLQLNMLWSWKNTVEKFSERFEIKIADFVLRNTDVQPPW